MFIIIFTLATACFVPGIALMFVGGLIFGPVLGAVYNMLGSIFGIWLTFLLGRYLFESWVVEHAGYRLKVLIQGVTDEGWLYVAFLRLLPVMPFNVLNYAMGLTRVPLIKYVVSSAVFTLPGCIAYTYVGYVGRAAAAGDNQLLGKIFIAMSLLFVLVIVPWLVKYVHDRRQKFLNKK